MSERETDSQVGFADPNSLLGMLQRGRGKGYLMAMEAPPEEVWPLLVECATNDPRSDDQWSPDEEYYASLILRTGMDLEPLLSFVSRNNASDDKEWNSYYSLEILRCLAHRGSRQALEFLRECVEKPSTPSNRCPAHGLWTRPGSGSAARSGISRWQPAVSSSIRQVVVRAPIVTSIEPICRLACSRISTYRLQCSRRSGPGCRASLDTAHRPPRRTCRPPTGCRRTARASTETRRRTIPEG